MRKRDFKNLGSEIFVFVVRYFDFGGNRRSRNVAHSLMVDEPKRRRKREERPKEGGKI